jgi:protoporphyrinogen oxidase
MAYKKKGGWGGARRIPLLTIDERWEVYQEYRSHAAAARIATKKKRASKWWHNRVRRDVARLCSDKFGKKVTERMVDRIAYGGWEVSPETRERIKRIANLNR